MDDQNRRTGRQFHLKQLIGAGAFGEVYLAEQDSGAGFKRKVAIKLLHADIAKMSKDAGRRMRDEARILGRLSHRNIVTVLDLIKLGDRWAVVMDFVPGADLEEIIQALEVSDQHFPGPAALECGAAILNGLHAAFYSTNDDGSLLGVIHRDIKPSNVRLTDDGEVKVLDFGVARVDMDTREAQTRSTGWIGTERYMSPERILCEGDSEAGDIYAACATILEIIIREPLGRTPVLPEKHHAFVEEALGHIKQRLEGPPEVIAEVTSCLRKGLDAEPGVRPSARELSDTFSQLSRKLEGESLEAFSRRFVAQIDQVLDRDMPHAEGVLSERTSASAVLSQQPATPILNPGLEGSTFDSVELDYAIAGVQASKVPESDSGVSQVNIGIMVGGGLSIAAVAALIVVVVGMGLLFTMSTNSGAPVDVPIELRDEVSIGGPKAEPAPTAPPVPVPAPTLEPALTEQPEPPTLPAPKPTPKTVSAPIASGPTVNRSLVVLPDASSITVKCGDISASGSASARIREFPSGVCYVSAVYLGKSYKAKVTIERPREVNCTIDGESFKCL
ncbi:MAG: protein kinase [Rhodobacterales bacterium]|nr:protein kinase [Rhodobacterales bacterium]